jgi:hypothetical protein
MAVGSFSRSVVLVIFLYLVLHLKPFKPHDIIPDAHQVLATALNAHRRVYPTRNTPGISRHSRQMPSTSPSVKAKVGCHLQC